MYRSYAIAAICLAALSACSGSTAREVIGLSREAPDEFRVVSRPPLSVPPQFSLRPPAEPGEEPARTAAHKKAESLVLGTPADSGDTFALRPGNADTAVSPVHSRPLNDGKNASPEQNFLMRAGANEADPEVRRKIERDRTAVAVPEDDSWWNILSTTPPKKEPMVNAKEEAERIKKNQEEGRPVTEGDTPEIKPRDTGVLGRILDY